MRKRIASRSTDRQWGPVGFSLNLWALPLPQLYGGWEREQVWFGVELGGTPSDPVVSLGLAFDLPGWLADAAWKAVVRARVARRAARRLAGRRGLIRIASRRH